MLPTQLTIKGLYSYQSEVSIDFTRLTESHIFGIFGAVGSGKSSILEAMAFALYGETERMNRSENRSYNMMNLKSDELYIDFQFRAGKNDADLYKFTVRGKRHSQKFEKIHSFERKAYKQNEGEWMPLETNNAEEILQLSYENFRRTIIIPQGKFQEFLHMGDTDRTRMLKEIFNLNKYELYDKVVIIEKENNQKIQHIEGAIDQIGEINVEQLEQKEKDLSDQEKQLQVITKEYEDLLKKEKVYELYFDVIQKYDNQKKVVHALTEKSSEIEKKEQKLQQYEYCKSEFQELINQIAQIQKKQDQQKAEREKNEKKHEGIQKEVSQLKGKFEACKKDYENRDGLKQKIAELEKMTAFIANNKKIAELQARLEKGQQVVATEEKKEQELKNQKEKNETAISLLVEKRNTYMRDLESAVAGFSNEDHAAKLVSQLQTGQPCMVCGSKDHPNPFTAHHSDASQKRLDEDTLQNIFQELKNVQAEIAVSEKQRQEIEKNIQQQLLNKEKYSKALQEFQQQMAVLNGQNEAIADECKTISFKDVSHIDEASISMQKQEIEAKYRSIEKEFKEIEALFDQKKTLFQTLGATIETQKKYEQSLRKEFEDVSSLITKKIEDSKFQSRLEIEEVLAQNLNIEQARSEIQVFQKSLHAAKEQLNDLIKQQEQMKKEQGDYESIEHEKLKTDIKDMVAQKDQKNRIYGELKKEIDMIQTNMQQQKKLMADLKELQKRASNISILKAMFVKSGFVNFVSSVYLHNLCEAANKRFHTLTRQKLRLEIQEDNSFAVRDFLHEGRMRSIKTLSGGQTFQAALCLALALADNIHHLQKSDQNFFFLDEGFGSLDKESLRLVFDTLKSLRNENRTVGVISHVEDLQQEIDVFLQVKNDEEKGSQVRASWEI